MRRSILALAACILAMTIARADDGPVTIKFKQTVVGDAIKESKLEKTSNKIAFTVNGMDQKKDEEAVAQMVYTQEILEKPAGAKRATKIKRVYQTAEFSKDGEKQDLELVGKTVLIEKSGDEYKITADGKDLSVPAAVLLAKEFKREKKVAEEDLIPKGPVKVGDTWKLDMDKIAKDIAADGLDVDVAKSSGAGKLLKVYDKAGHKNGVLELKMELMLKKIGEGDQAIETKAGSKLELTITLDMCIDGSTAAATTKVTAKGDFSGTTNGIDIKFDLTSTSEGSAEEVKKK